MYIAFHLKLLDKIKSLLLVTMNYDGEKLCNTILLIRFFSQC
jgi:hypothetical protein